MNLIDSDNPSLITPAHHLQAYLAEAAGYETGFFLDEDGTLTDAECQTVPPLETLCIENPRLIGKALTWLANRG